MEPPGCNLDLGHASLLFDVYPSQSATLPALQQTFLCHSYAPSMQLGFNSLSGATAAFVPRRAQLTTQCCRSTPAVTMSLRLPGGGRSGLGGLFGGLFGRNSARSGFGSGGGFGMGSGGRMGSGGGKGRSGDGAAGSSDGGNIFTAMWSGYNASLDKNPIFTKALTSLVGFFLGDLLAQKFLGEKGTELDMARLARMASFGFLIHGPTGHYFYSALDRLIVGKSAVKVASKVAIDQVLWAPVFTALFFTYLGVTERKSKDEIIKKIKDDTWIGVKTSWKVI